METTTKISSGKNKMDEALAKAKKSSVSVKQSANVLKAGNGQLITVPGFENYAVDSKFTELISKKTGKVQQIPTGKKKYLIYDDKGQRRPISMDEIKLLMPKQTKKVAAGNSKGESKKSQILRLFSENKSVKEISDETGISYNTVYVTIKVHRIVTLHADGKTVKQIVTATGFTEEAVIRNIGTIKK